MPEQKVKFISKEELFEMMENKEDIIVVEVLPKEDYDAGHIPFAINIPVNLLDTQALALLPRKDQRIVVYCSSFICTASTGAARKLQSMGYTNVLDYKGGKQDWSRADLPLLQS